MELAWAVELSFSLLGRCIWPIRLCALNCKALFEHLFMDAMVRFYLASNIKYLILLSIALT